MQREVRLIFGQTGSGKTCQALSHFQTCQRAFVAECGYDEFPAMRFESYPEAALYLDKLGAFTNRSAIFRVSYTPRFDEFGLIFETALALKNCWLFLEEADRFGDPYNCPEFQEVLIRGRHDMVSLNAGYLRPYDCPISLRAQATQIISFRQTEPADLLWLKGKVGDIVAELPNLPGPAGPPPAPQPPFPFLLWDYQGARIVKI